MNFQPRTSSRPFMPENYRILAEHEGSGLLPWTRASERLAASHNYWIHTTRTDARPHAKPVWGLWFEGHFYFGTGQNSVDGLNLSADPSIAVHLESGNDVVILEGSAETVSEPELLSKLDESYYSKYSYHLVSRDGSPVYVVRHKVAFAWLERDFVGSATRYRFQI
jgi:hypothetical protein